MKNKRIFIWGYWTKNFGDDLFLKTYLESVNIKNQNIYILTKKKFKDYYSKMGFKVIISDSFKYRLINKIICFFNLPELYYLKVSKKTIFIMLGGSLFAENKPNYVERKQLQNLNYAVQKSKASFIIGSNFGPYKTLEFLNNYKKLFKNVNDICFRDQYSYSLFNNELNNVRYTQDIAFEKKWPNLCKEINNNVVISIMDLSERKDLKNFYKVYEQNIVNVCNYHLKNNEKVILIPFCDSEGDLNSALRVYAEVDESLKKDISIFSDSSVEGITEVISKCRKIYATRFHAVMMGMYFQKKLVPIVYNKKTIDAISSYTNLNDKNIFLINEFTDKTWELMVNTSQIFELKLKKESQFQSLNAYLTNIF